jgi:hypothetical protein
MPRVLSLIAVVIAAALPAAAEDEGAARIGDDAFLAGGMVSIDEAGVDDVFAAADRFRLSAPIAGGAYIAARRIEIAAPAAGDVFAAGMDVAVTGGAGGDLTVAGYDVRTEGTVGGDLRGSGATLSVAGPVAGYASLAGETLRIDAAVTGDAHIAGRTVEFGPAARVDGTLYLYEEREGRIEVPERVAPADRVTRIAVEGTGPGSMPARIRPPSWRQLVANFLLGVLFITAAAALIAAVLPRPLAELRRLILAAPLRALWFGFLALSLLAGAGIVLGITLIGLFVTPAAVLAALAAAFLGYVIGAYALGVGLLLALGRDEPDSLPTRALAAGAGALVAAVIALIPLIGWLFVLAVTLAGVGALALRLFRPAFFAAPPPA